MMLLDDGIEHDTNLHGARPEVGIVIPSLCPFFIYFTIKFHINPDVVLDHTRSYKISSFLGSQMDPNGEFLRGRGLYVANTDDLRCWTFLLCKRN